MKKVSGFLISLAVLGVLWTGNPGLQNIVSALIWLSSSCTFLMFALVVHARSKNLKEPLRQLSKSLTTQTFLPWVRRAALWISLAYFGMFATLGAAVLGAFFVALATFAASEVHHAD